MVDCAILVHKMYVWSGFSKVSIKESWTDGCLVGRMDGWLVGYVEKDILWMVEEYITVRSWYNKYKRQLDGWMFGWTDGWLV